jgi:hypothetical protein
VVSRDKPVKRSAQDDDFVGVLKKNIPKKVALMGRRPMSPAVEKHFQGSEEELPQWLLKPDRFAITYGRPKGRPLHS